MKKYTTQGFYTMSGNKPLGFFGCNYDYVLITDIMESWGDNLQNLPDCDRYYLISLISENVGLFHLTEETSENAEEINGRIMGGELPQPQMQALISAIVNGGTHPLGYWGLNYEHKLIKDMGETFGENLKGMSDTDSYDILSTLGYVLYQQFGATSEQCDSCCDRIAEHELPLGQLQALIQALGN